MVSKAVSIALHNEKSVFSQVAKKLRSATAARNAQWSSRLRAGESAAGNVKRSGCSSGNRGGAQYHGRRKIAPDGGAYRVAQELSARQSRAVVRELGGGTELAVGSRGKNGSGKTIGPRSLDASPQGRNISRAEIVVD